MVASAVPSPIMVMFSRNIYALNKMVIDEKIEFYLIHQYRCGKC